MADDDFNWIAEQAFRCRTPDGKTFPVLVRLGMPELVDDGREERLARYHHRCRLGLDPLALDRWIGGNNAFQALCLSLDYVRTVFKVFVAEGGRLYWGDEADSPVDLDSPWFAPMPGIAQIGLKLSSE